MATITPPPPAISLAPSTAPVTPLTPPPLKPGYATSEGWISLLTVLLGALPSLLAQSKLLANAPPLITQVVGLVVGGVAAIHFTGQRTALKRAHLAMQAPPIASEAFTKLLSGLAAITLIVAVGCASCGARPGATGGASLGSAASKGLACEGVNLDQDVKNIPLLTKVALDLASANYIGAIADLVATLGAQTVGCAVLAIDDLDSATADTGSGSAAKTAELGSRLLRARELERQYGWQRAARAGSGSGSAAQ